jgi:thiosulfate reductase/polysulfide reductase chain A
VINRRKFLRVGVLTATAAPALVNTDAQAEENELKKGGQDFSYLSGTGRDSVATACALCASRCAAVAYLDGGYVVKVEGQPESNRTIGKLCAKGQAGHTQVYDPDRILKPMKRAGKRGEGKWEQITWDAALGELSERLEKLRSDGHPEKFMFHHGWISASADRLINKVFLPTYGTGTISDNSCLGQSARLMAHELTWGDHYDNWDFDNTRYVLNFGSNVMEAHTNHVALARRLSYALTDKNLKMVTFDVRLSNTAAKSHTWIQIRPGTDCAVVLAMCNVIMNDDLFRGEGEDFLNFCQVTPDPNASTDEKITALKQHLADYTPEWAEKISAVPAADIRSIAREFASARPACIISSRGATSNFNGVETERTIQMLAAITGNIDNPGGRCMGVVPEWRYPRGPEDKPVAKRLEILEGFKGEVALPVHGVGHQVLKMIEDGSAGRPEVYLWYNYNPVFSNGNSDHNADILMDESLIPYTVAVTPFYDESAALADLILPDAVYLETYDFEDGISPTQTAEYYIRQPVVAPQGEARDFKDVCCELAERMGFPLGFKSAEEFLKQSCELTPAVKEKAGGFNGMKKWGVWYDKKAKPVYHAYTQPVAEASLQADGVIFDAETGVYWNWKAAGANSEEEARADGYRRTPNAYQGYVAQKFGDQVYKGFIPSRINKSGYFELYSSILADLQFDPLPSHHAIPEHESQAEDELVLTTFRVNVQTLSRTQNCRWLSEINIDQSAWMNPATAEARGILDGDRVKLKTKLGEIEVEVKVTHNVVPGVVAISSHGGHWEYGRYASSKKAPFSLEQDKPYEELKWWSDSSIHPNRIIENLSEPISGQQRWMDTLVSVAKIAGSA